MNYKLNDVFVPGGQPTVTFVERSDQNIQKQVKRAIAMPNHLVSISGPSKIGKTVLCKNALKQKEYVWVDGGRVENAKSFWELISCELNISASEEHSETTSIEAGAEGGIPMVVTANGSTLYSSTILNVRNIDGMNAATKAMIDNDIMLVVDDFHYINDEARRDIVRNLKGPIFNGMKVILLSANHRVFDAIKAEVELTGRFVSVTIPAWNDDDLIKIPNKGFKALDTNCDEVIIKEFVKEAQSNPMLLQKLCWELCVENDIEGSKLLGKNKIDPKTDLRTIYKAISSDAGLPIYQKLKSGPQARKLRMMRPLKVGGEVDIYEAILLSIANTGPKSEITYDELRTGLTELLADLVPQKHEITSALKHLTKISQADGMASALDWDESTSLLSVTAPYLRFYLKWQISKA